jgi:hypothetical protein
MDELREAVRVLAEEVRATEAALSRGAGVPSKGQLAQLQKGVDAVQQRLNRLQTAMDVWSEEPQSV